jgi:glycosyltransferase involved in cell wall biosynthesis
MMATGKHVIATGYSAHTEFCTKDNCSIIPITDTEPAFDGKWFFGQGNWAKIDESVVQALQYHMENFIENDKRTINEEGVETAKHFSWQRTASEIIKNV